MTKILLSLINFYQRLPLKSHDKCRFYPTCSNYAKEAIKRHGLIKGLFLTFKRLLKCNPFYKGSPIDLVPPLNKKN